MANLKLLKNREQDLGHEFDLRGLGDDPIVRESDPIAVLSIAGEEDGLHKIMKLVQEYGLGVNLVKGSDQLHIQAGPAIQGGHKVQTVELYGLSLFLISKLQQSEDLIFSLWIADRLRFHLKKTQASIFDLNDQEVVAHIRWDGFLTLAQSVTLFLNQAGFAIARSQQQVVLDRPTALAHVQRELMQQKSALQDEVRRAA